MKEIDESKNVISSLSSRKMELSLTELGKIGEDGLGELADAIYDPPHLPLAWVYLQFAGSSTRIPLLSCFRDFSIANERAVIG